MRGLGNKVLVYPVLALSAFFAACGGHAKKNNAPIARLGNSSELPKAINSPGRKLAQDPLANLETRTIRSYRSRRPQWQHSLKSLEKSRAYAVKAEIEIEKILSDTEKLLKDDSLDVDSVEIQKKRAAILKNALKQIDSRASFKLNENLALRRRDLEKALRTTESWIVIITNRTTGNK